ncbi:Replication protein A subunit, partial [Stegodyphus mimosarum]
MLLHLSNEITMHIAEVIHTSISVAVMDKQGGSTAGNTMSFGASNTMASGLIGSSDTFASNASRRLTKPQQLVLQAVNACKDEQGISTFDLYSSLKSLNRQSIQEALEFLSNEG